MKLRHQNDSDENSHSSSTNDLGDSNKLVNGVKKSISSIKNQPSPKTLGTNKVSSAIEVSTLSKKSSEVSQNVGSPADSVKSTNLPPKLLSGTFLVKNNLRENSTSDKNLKESEKSIKFDVEFEDSDEEDDDNVALKTLMENLDKGLNTNEDAKNSQAMIDDLMSDILEKDTITEVKEQEKNTEICSAENQDEVKKKAKKREAEEYSNSRTKCIKLDMDNLEASTKNSSELDIVVLNNISDLKSTESENSKGSSSSNSEIAKDLKSEEIKSKAKQIKCVNGESTEKNVNGESTEKNVNGESSEKNVNEKVSAENIRESTKVIEKNVVSNGVSLDTSCEDDDILEILDVNNKREADSPADDELAQKRLKSRLESYLTRPVAESNASESEVDLQNSEKKSSHQKEKIYKLTKAELETLIINKVTDYFSDAHKSEIGAIRKRCEHLEKMLEQWRKKAVFYQRKVTDFQIAVQRIQIRRQTAIKPPMRSVGLQVQLIKDPSKYVNPAVPTGGKHSVLVPTGNVKSVLPKLPPNNQMAFFTSLGTHGALSTATLVANNAKPNSQNVMKAAPIIPNGSATNVSILQAKLATPTINVTSAAPIPLRLIQNQAIRPANSTSSSAASTSITVSLVNQQPLLTSTGVKLIDLTGEEQEEAAKAAAKAAVTAAASVNKRIIPKSIAATQISASGLPAGLTMVPTLNANSNTLTVISTSNASLNSGHLLTLSAGTVSTVANLSTVGVTTPAIRGPTTTPIIGSTTPVRLAYLMPTGMTMVRQPGGQPVLMAPATQVRSNQQIMKPTLVIRQGTTILPIQNGQLQQTQIRPVLSTNASAKVLIATTAVSMPTPTTTTTVVKANLAKPTGSSTSILVASPSAIHKTVAVVNKSIAVVNKTVAIVPLKHPAPLPPNRVYHMETVGRKQSPPKPALKISKVDTGIVLSWNMILTANHAQISSYQLYAYQENDSPPQTSLWKKVGDVRALPLPMACTLTQFNEGHKYYFAVRSVDAHNRMGPFSEPGSITLLKTAPKKS